MLDRPIIDELRIRGVIISIDGLVDSETLSDVNEKLATFFTDLCIFFEDDNFYYGDPEHLRRQRIDCNDDFLFFPVTFPGCFSLTKHTYFSHSAYAHEL